MIINTIHVKRLTRQRDRGAPGRALSPLLLNELHQYNSCKAPHPAARARRPWPAGTPPTAAQRTARTPGPRPAAPTACAPGERHMIKTRVVQQRRQHIAQGSKGEAETHTGHLDYSPPSSPGPSICALKHTHTLRPGTKYASVSASAATRTPARESPATSGRSLKSAITTLWGKGETQGTSNEHYASCMYCACVKHSATTTLWARGATTKGRCTGQSGQRGTSQHSAIATPKGHQRAEVSNDRHVLRCRHLAALAGLGPSSSTEGATANYGGEAPYAGEEHSRNTCAMHRKARILSSVVDTPKE